MFSYSDIVQKRMHCIKRCRRLQTRRIRWSRRSRQQRCKVPGALWWPGVPMESSYGEHNVWFWTWLPFLRYAIHDGYAMREMRNWPIRSLFAVIIDFCWFMQWFWVQRAAISRFGRSQKSGDSERCAPVNVWGYGLWFGFSCTYATTQSHNLQHKM